MRWAGHAARSDENSLLKNIMIGRPAGTRPPGRPRDRWIDNIKKDVIKLGLEDPNRWLEVAANRREWKKLVKAARDQQGPTPTE